MKKALFNIRTYKVLVLILTLIFIGIFISATDLQKLAASLQKVGYRFVILIFTTFIAYLLGTISWRYCMGTPGKLMPVSTLFVIRHIGETLSMVTPAGVIGGEAAKIYLLQGKGLDKKIILASILLSRAIMVLSQLTLFTLVLGIMLSAGMQLSIPLPHFLPYIIALFICMLLTCIFITKNRLAYEFLLKLKPVTFLTKKLAQFFVKLKAVKGELLAACRDNKKSFLLSFIFCCLHWIAGGLEFYFILQFLGIPVGAGQALLVDMGVMFFKAAGAFVPGQIGVEEYGNKMMLASIGIHDESIWITASVLRRARQLFWIAFGGYLYFFIYRNQSSLLKYGDGHTVYKP